MNFGKKYFLGLVLLSLLSLAYLSASDVSLTENEWTTLKMSLTMAEKRLTESEAQISNLQSLLTSQKELLTSLETELTRSQKLCEKQATHLETLTEQLMTASKSLQTLKNETTWTTIKMILTALVCVAAGGAVGYLIAR